MLRKIGHTLFGSCIPDRNKVSAKATILSIKDTPLDALRLSLTDEALSARTHDGLTPVLAACVYGRVDVLMWLVQERGQSLYIRDNAGNGPVELAAQYDKHDIVQQLFLPTAAGGLGWTSAKDAALKNFPHDRDVALQAAPQTVMYFYADTTASQGADHVPATHVMEIDLTTKEKTMYKFGVELAAGAFGKISWYQHDKKVKLVKTPHTPVWASFVKNDATQASFTNSYLLPESTNCASFIKRVRREYKFMCLINPHYGPYSLQILQREQNEVTQYSYAITMSMIPGSHPSLLLMKMHSALAAAKLILCIIEALNKLHQEKNIIHGDIRDKNILVIPHGEENEIEYEIVFIDFAFTYRRNKKAVPFLMPINKHDDHVAPERLNYVVDAHTAQDVWSLGATLDGYMKIANKQFPDLLGLFPSIELFLTISRCHDYRTRPTLPDLIKILNGEIEKIQANRCCSLK